MKDQILHIVSKYHREFKCDNCGHSMFVKKGEPMTRTFAFCLKHSRRECSRCYILEAFQTNENGELLKALVGSMSQTQRLELISTLQRPSERTFKLGNTVMNIES